MSAPCAILVISTGSGYTYDEFYAGRILLPVVIPCRDDDGITEQTKCTLAHLREEDNRR